jgi:hypothetical protein
MSERTLPNESTPSIGSDTYKKAGGSKPAKRGSAQSKTKKAALLENQNSDSVHGITLADSVFR